MKQIQAECRFCGQTRIVDVPDAWDEPEIEEKVTRECSCFEARAYNSKKEEEERIENAKLCAKATIHELFSEEFPEVEQLFTAAIGPLCDKKFKKLTVKTDDKTSGSIAYSMGSIKVTREDKSKYSRETEI